MLKIKAKKISQGIRGFGGAALIALCAQSVSASPYVGIAIGEADGAIAHNEKTTSFLLSGGYYFSDYVAGEVQYLNLGNLNVGYGEIVLDGLAGLVVVNLPLAETVDVFAKVGFYSWESSYSEEGYRYNYEEDLNSDTNFIYALGINFAIAPKFDVVAEYQEIDFDFDDEGSSNFSLGLRYYFW